MTINVALSGLFLGSKLITAVTFRPDLPSSITELSLDYNRIIKVEVEDLIRYKNLQR